jgi:uncharacterized protein YmfQ (DUF2313 family)
MSLSATAERMLETVPAYYDGEPLMERLFQAGANEIDRMDALVDQVTAELQPGQATDALGLLGAWEATEGLPVMPVGATETQRQAKINAALQKLDSGSGRAALATIQAAMGAGAFTVDRDTPVVLEDTLNIPYLAGTYNAAVIQAIALKIWPAHRALFIRYGDGFILELSRLDADSL